MDMGRVSYTVGGAAATPTLCFATPTFRGGELGVLRVASTP